MTVVLISGGFDPLHSGHVAYINEAARLGSKLIVALNSDDWLTRKKNKPFMPFDERKTILSNLKFVDYVYEVDDTDGSVIDAIRYCLKEFPDDKIVFANGGDRTKTNIPEMSVQDTRLSFVFGIGGENKLNSSSKILSEWKDLKKYRDWGHWRVLDDKQPRLGQKIKELVIDPGSSLSDQKHLHRNEHWYVLEGTIKIELEDITGTKQTVVLTEHNSFVIPQHVWHKTTNIGENKAHIVEIQYGERCVEEDIVRR